MKGFISDTLNYEYILILQAKMNIIKELTLTNLTRNNGTFLSQFTNQYLSFISSSSFSIFSFLPFLFLSFQSASS